MSPPLCGRTQSRSAALRGHQRDAQRCARRTMSGPADAPSVVGESEEEPEEEPVDTTNPTPVARELLWTPSADRVAASRMAHYLDWVNARLGTHLEGYDELWRWSIDDLDAFWQSTWDYFDVVASLQPRTALA